MDRFHHSSRSVTDCGIVRGSGSKNECQAVALTVPCAARAGCSASVGREPLTARQFEILVAIEVYLDAHGFPPTLRELCEAMQLHSTNGMRQHVEALVRKGYLAREKVTARSMRVLVASKDAVVLPGVSKVGGATCRHCGKVSA